MISAISAGHSDITNAVSSGLDDTRKAVEVVSTSQLFSFIIINQTSGENGRVGLDVLNAALVTALTGGYQQVRLVMIMRLDLVVWRISDELKRIYVNTI